MGMEEGRSSVLDILVNEHELCCIDSIMFVTVNSAKIALLYRRYIVRL